MKWDPWSLYKNVDGDDLPIVAPPSPGCVFWRPVVLTKYVYVKSLSGGVQAVSDGIRCCHADEMFHDFSCFTEKVES